MTEFKVVERSRLVQGRGRVAWAGTTKIAVFLVDGRVYAMKNFCPHAGGSLGTGRVNGLVVECPRHKWGFHLQTGACLKQKMYAVKTYPAEVRDGYVWVDIPPE